MELKRLFFLQGDSLQSHELSGTSLPQCIFFVWNAQSRKIKLNTLKQVNHQNVSNSNAVCSNKNKRLFDQPGYKNLLNLSVEGGRFYEYITLHLDKGKTC